MKDEEIKQELRKLWTTIIVIGIALLLACVLIGALGVDSENMQKEISTLPHKYCHEETELKTITWKEGSMDTPQKGHHAFYPLDDSESATCNPSSCYMEDIHGKFLYCEEGVCIITTTKEVCEIR